MQRLVASGMLLGVAVACGRARHDEIRPAAVPASEFARLGDALLPHYRIFRPEGRGPFPTVIFVSGCSGFAHPRAPEHYRRVAERVSTRGRAVIFADYVKARGVVEACRGIMRPEEVGRYVLAAVAYGRTLPFVNASELDAVGWSLGGGGVMAALAALPNPAIPPLRVAVALYPDCSDLAPWQTPVRTLVLLAGRDAVQSPERCEQVTAQVRAPAHITVRRYPDAHHGFDMEGLPTEPVPGLPPLAYDAASAVAAWEAIDQILVHTSPQP